MRRRDATAWLVASALGGLQSPAWAQPQEGLDMVKVLLGVPPGSMVDLVARKFAEALKKGYAVNTVVENRTGASGIIAVAGAKAAPPDGKTVLVATASPITIYPLIHKKLPYNPQVDLIPISTLVTFDLALAVGPLVPREVTNLREFYAWCAANPAKASFGSPGSGSTPHFLGSMTARLAGANVQHVGYRGPVAAVTDMVGGQVAAAVVPLTDLVEFHAGGKCRILASTGSNRSRFVPAVPTFQEQGLGEYAAREWIGAFLPAGTPAPLVQKLSNSMKAALGDSAVVASMGANVQEVVWCTPEALKARIDEARAKWAVAVEALNFSMDT